MISENMSDQSRQQKLASAKKKLKKYQQGKSPDGQSPADEQLGKEIIRGIQNNHIFKTPPLTVSTNKQNQSINQLNTVISNSKDPQKLINKVKYSDSDASHINGDAKYNLTPLSSHPSKPTAKSHQSFIGRPTNNTDASETTKTANEKYSRKECSVNNDLEESLASYKRVNGQLGSQVNEQRKIILQLQEQLKKDNLSLSQLADQRALKEQLEVHIQTIGILVSEKSELQSNNSGMQKKMTTKESELAEANNQLRNMQQQFVDIQKNVSKLQSTEGQLRQTNREVIQERDRFSSNLYKVNQEKEDLLLQNSELHTKLRVKVEECATLLNQVNQLHLKLQQGDLIVQQLSANGIDLNNLTKWNEEKEELLKTVDEQKEMVRRLVHDKAELLEKHNDIQGHYDLKFEQLKNTVNLLELEKIELLEKSSTLSEKVDDLQNQLSLKSSKVAETPEVDRDMKFNLELENAVNDKVMLEKELDIQINENRRLSRLVFEQNVKIEELEANIKNLNEASGDKSALLEQIQADKETISRALAQNKTLKEQLEELENGFVKMSNNSADLTDKLEAEQHGNKDVASKLGAVQMDLEESKLQLQEKMVACSELEKQLQQYKEECSNLTAKVNSGEMDIDLLKTQLDTVNNELTLKEHNLAVALESSKLVEKLQEELNSAQSAVNQLSHRNFELNEKLDTLQATKKLDGHLYPEREHFTEPSVSGNVEVATETEEKEESRSFEGLDNESDIMNDKEAIMITRAEIDDMENKLNILSKERDDVLELLQAEREKSLLAVNSLDKHVHLQVEQQLKQRERELSEHFYEKTEALQNKVRSLQDALEIMRKNEDIGDFDMVSDGITMPLLKTAFMQLQKRYKSAMDAKAQLFDRIEHLEHVNVQLENETETIGEYITLYQNQRSALKAKFEEKDQIIQQLSNEHGRMQTKVTQLHHLVMQMLSERSGIESKNKHLQELVNRRMALQNGGATSEVPKLEYDLDNLFGQMTFTPDEEAELVKDNIPVHEDMRSDSQADQTTQQILQIFEQLETTGEGFQPGWLSPAARKHDFQPCKNCMGPLFSL